MTRHSELAFLDDVDRQGANALIASTLEFLRTKNVPKRLVLESVRDIYNVRKPRRSSRQYRKLIRAYQDMGILMSTWFSAPRFLDKECRALPLTTKSGALSISTLVRISRVAISATVAKELMRRSPSIKLDDSGNFVALRREFVLPEFEVLRAALVIERYLDTLHRNSAPSKKKPFLLLERSCHVPEVNLRAITPFLRDIKRRGSAYIESVNGDIEGLRRKKSAAKEVGEMSVHIFAWTRLPSGRRGRLRKPI
jgi:hypothetical protein